MCCLVQCLLIYVAEFSFFVNVSLRVDIKDEIVEDEVMTRLNVLP